MLLRRICGPILAACVAGTALSLPAERSAAAGAEQENADRAQIGLDIADQSGVVLSKRDPLVGWGSYLANAIGCNDCHTWPNYTANGNPFNRQPEQVDPHSYLAGGRLFPLPTENVCSRNITPAPDTGMPAGLSLNDFVYVMRTGCDPQDADFRDPRRCGLLQVMPWPEYRHLTSYDLTAIYAYLSALPHAEPGPAAQCAPDPQGIAAP